MKMRMRDLARESGLKPSTLQFYLREGLIPPPERPTANSALYGEAHLSAARTLKRLREMSPRIALPPLRRALELVQQGVEAEVALSLQDKVFERGLGADMEPMDLKTFAVRLGVKPADVKALCAGDVLVPLVADGRRQFDAIDLEIARMALMLQQMSPDGLAVAARIAAHIAKASRLEIGLRNSITRGRGAQEAAQVSARMQDWVNVWHAYLFARFRVREIAEHGLGRIRKGKDAP
jgi:DNA-binding transcriptional MerR regulator